MEYDLQKWLENADNEEYAQRVLLHISQQAARIEQLDVENTALIKAVAEMAHEDGTNAKRMRAGIVAARKKLAISRFNWTGPILQADNILAQSLTVINDSAALEDRT